MNNYRLVFKVRDNMLDYSYNKKFNICLKEYIDMDILLSYGVYFNNAYFSNTISCENCSLFLSTNEEIVDDFICNKSKEFEKNGFILDELIKVEDNCDNIFLLVTPLVYKFPIINGKESVDYIISPDALINNIKNELGLDNNYKVKFISKNRNIKSMQSVLGNVWGYSGKLEFQDKINLDKFGIGDNLLQKSGYNCIVAIKNI